MKKKLSILLASTFISLCSAWAATSSNEEQTMARSLENLVVLADLPFESEYVYRGSKRAQKSFQPSIEAFTPIYQGELYTGIWTNLPIESSSSMVATEVDPYMGYAFIFQDIYNVDFGFTYYWYTRNSALRINRTREIYLGISVDWTLDPSIFAYYDFDLHQWTLEGSMAYSYDLEERFNIKNVTLDSIGQLGFVHTGHVKTIGFSKKSNGYVYTQFSSDLTYHVNPFSSLSLGVRLSANTDKKKDPANFLGRHPVCMWWGVKASFGF